MYTAIQKNKLNYSILYFYSSLINGKAPLVTN